MTYVPRCLTDPSSSAHVAAAAAPENACVCVSTLVLVQQAAVSGLKWPVGMLTLV